MWVASMTGVAPVRVVKGGTRVSFRGEFLCPAELPRRVRSRRCPLTHLGPLRLILLTPDRYV